MESQGPFGKKKGEEKPPADQKKETGFLTPPPEMKPPASSPSIGRIVLPFQKMPSSPPPEPKPSIPPPAENFPPAPPEITLSSPVPAEKLPPAPPEITLSSPVPEEKIPPAPPEIKTPSLPPVQKPAFLPPEQKERKLLSNYFLLVIPSWHKATGTPLGMYINANVARIHSDPVIFFSTKEVAVETPMGTTYYLFGLGYYYVQFELADGKLITDNRPLTGLVLSDFFYDKLATSKRLALDDETDVNVCEHVIKVPVDLSHKTEQKRTFIRGVITRFLFMAYKDPILDMLGKITDPESYLLDRWGHLLLSTRPEFFNQILVSNKMGAGAIRTYMNNAAGINAIIPAAEDMLQTTFSSANLLDIDESIQMLKTALMGVKYDPIDLYTLLDYLAMTLRAASIIPAVPAETTTMSPSNKRAILMSAASRSNAIAEWPAHLSPALAEATETGSASTSSPATGTPEFKDLVHQFYKKMDDASYGDASQTTAVKVEAAGRESFQLRKMQRSATDKKTLPECPQGNIEEIFLYLKWVIDENFDMPSVGKAFENARESVRKISLQSKYLRLMSRWANLFVLKQAGLSLSPKEKETVMHEVDDWISDFEEEKRKERERLEKERLEKERLERERLEQERQERERLAREEQERIEKDRKVREHLAQLERERLEQQRAEKERFEREHQARLEAERLQKEREEQARQAREHEEQVRAEKQRLADEKENLKRLTKERKQKEKEEKARQKELKKIEKEKEKIEKQKQKEAKRLEQLKGE